MKDSPQCVNGQFTAAEALRLDPLWGGTGVGGVNELGSPLQPPGFRAMGAVSTGGQAPAACFVPGPAHCPHPIVDWTTGTLCGLEAAGGPDAVPSRLTQVN